MTSIEWTDVTWNPVRGCTKVSPGCDNCYAERVDTRFNGPGAFDTVRLVPERLDQPLRWRKPRRVFVNSMSDLFHDAIPDEYIARVFAVMAATPHHTYQILTKRPGRMRSLLNRKLDLIDAADATGDERPGWALYEAEWPLPNVWLGVSVEDQKRADLRIPALLDTPAAVRWISAEPLLGPVDLKNAALRPYERQQGGYWEYGPGVDVFGNGKVWVPAPPAQLDWVVVGGESGPGARPMHPDWARGLRDQCTAAGVPYFFKQWGAYRWVAGDRWDAETRCWVDDGIVPQRVSKKLSGRELDGRTWDEFPGAVVGRG